MLRLALLFLVLIVYGSLYPFSGWGPPAAPLFQFLTEWPQSIDHADLLQNLLVYAPLGLFLCLWRLGRAAPPSQALIGAAAVGLAVSALMESVQQFEPARYASAADIAMNLVGTVAGALLALVFCPAVAAPAAMQGRGRHALHWLRWISRAQRWRARRFHSGTLPNIGLAALALWALSQTSPLVPALDGAYLARKLGALAWELRHPLQLGVAGTLVSACLLTGLGLLLRSVLRTDVPAAAHAWAMHGPPATAAGTATAAISAPAAPECRIFVGMLALVFSAKLLAHGRMLGLSDVLGAALALVVLHLVRAASTRAVPMLGTGALLMGFILGEVLPGGALAYWPFNWVPLAGQLQSLSGMESLLELFWPFFALSYFARMATAPARRLQASCLGGLLVLALVFWLEWHQQVVPGRYGDITQVLLALGGWLLPLSFHSSDFIAGAPGPPCRAGRPASLQQDQAGIAARTGAHGRGQSRVVSH